ncbi:BglG family transcription antiterminator [Bacillus infantis]|nr:BglG family transcription antiterminator [Bacillus infantis]
MTNRQKELLRILLLHEEGALQIKDLSGQLGCVEKTVRNDLDRIEDYLGQYEGTSLIRKPGVGISIEIDEAARSEILQSLFSEDSKTMEERLFEMAFQLLTSGKAITLKFWAERYFVPNASIKKDLEIIAQWLERFDLLLVSRQRLGHLIEGTELNKRNALAHLSGLIPSGGIGRNPVLDLFQPYEIDMVRKALKEIQTHESIRFTDEALDSLVVHALIMIKRTRQRAPVFVEPAEMEKIASRKEYEYAAAFFTRLADSFQLAFPEAEIVYYTWHFISAKRSEEAESVLIQDEKAEHVVQLLIERMEKLTLFPFGNDHILANGLAVHMHSVISRIHYGFPITNPLLANIKRMYPYMFSMVILALDDIKERFHISIPEDEAAYIVLHFQASIERLEGKRNIEKKRAIIVCHMGIGMSHLLEAKIEQQYAAIEIAACIGKAEVAEALEAHKPDFIISTVPLEKAGTGYIQISPLFGQEDKERLSQFVDNLHTGKTGSREESFADLMEEDLIFLHVKKEHRYEVVEMLAMALYQKGYAAKEFIHSTVNRERNSATAIGGGISIPHGDPSMISRTAIAAAILDKPLEWGSEKVSLVFLLAVAKENQRDIRRIIGKIASLSESPAAVHELVSAGNAAEFLKMLKQQ